MAEGGNVYFEEHKESRDLGRLALRGGAVAIQFDNGGLQAGRIGRGGRTTRNLTKTRLARLKIGGVSLADR
jgi:hypothetical protein